MDPKFSQTGIVSGGSELEPTDKKTVVSINMHHAFFQVLANFEPKLPKNDEN